MDVINLRQKQEYLADDGRHIETFETIRKISRSIPKDEDESNEDLPDNIYYGILVVQTPMGNQPIRFIIQDAKSVDEAFEMYYDVREVFIKEMEAQAEARKEPQIITPDKTLVQTPGLRLVQDE